MKKRLLFLALSAALFSCRKDAAPVNEEELITTVTLTFTEVGGTGTATATFKDLDGDGGNPPSVFQTIALKPNKVYNFSATFTDETKTPAADITAEIVREGNDHQLYYVSSSTTTLNVTNLNVDNAGITLGTSGRFVTGATSTGNVTVTLKHKPGIKAPADPISKGDTDIEIVWPFNIQP